MDKNTNVQQEMAQVPLAVFEAEQNRNERREKRHLITIIVLILALVATNAGWLLYESQFDAVAYETVNQTNENSNDIDNSITQYK